MNHYQKWLCSFSNKLLKNVTSLSKMTLQFCHIYLRAQIKAASISTWVPSHEGITSTFHHCSHCFCWWEHSFVWRWAIAGDVSRQVNWIHDPWPHRKLESWATWCGGLHHHTSFTLKQHWPIGQHCLWSSSITITVTIQNPSYWGSDYNGSSKSIKICCYHYTTILKIYVYVYWIKITIFMESFLTCMLNRDPIRLMIFWIVEYA